MDHNKIIAAAGKRVLSPHGIQRHGKSRIWYDDHGWWAVVVEFQPSGWSRGSYLNVGLSWMLYERSGWGWDIGGRESGFESADSDEQFGDAMTRMAEHALMRVRQFREQFSSVSLMRAYYNDQIRWGGWSAYYAGVLSGLARDWDDARTCLSRVADKSCEAAWQHGVRLRCLGLLRAIGDREWFRETVLGIVMRSRGLHCLEELPPDEIALP